MGKPRHATGQTLELPLENTLASAPYRKVPDARLALKRLHDVCKRMDLEAEANRPSEAEYRAAMSAAQAVLSSGLAP